MPEQPKKPNPGRNPGQRKRAPEKKEKGKGSGSSRSDRSKAEKKS